jgi:hypothetical protein
MRIFMANDPDKLLARLRKGAPFAVVEAEWGEREIGVADGAVVAYNHHGPRYVNEPPSLAPRLPTDGPVIHSIGTSHFDLDCLLGVMALKRTKPSLGHHFYELAAYIDTHGAHRVYNAMADSRDIKRWMAFCAWSEEHELRPPADGSVADFTEEFEEAEQVLLRIFDDDQQLLLAGHAWWEGRRVLSRDSYQGHCGPVVLRRWVGFTNHLYATADGFAFDGCVAHDPSKGSVTLSLAAPERHPEVSCERVAQALWGPLAGGQRGIAGSPRGKEMDPDELERAGQALATALGWRPQESVTAAVSDSDR